MSITDLGRVRVSSDGAQSVRSAVIKITRWLRDLRADDPRLPRRLGAILPNSRFTAWSVRYVIALAKNNHNDWPPQILQRSRRAAILKNRKHVLGVCRVTPAEADEFGQACLGFIETYCEPTEKIKQAEFLTLAAVAFADRVGKVGSLDKLPPPPWLPLSLFPHLNLGV